MLAPALGINGDGDYRRDRDDPAGGADLQVGGIEPQIAESDLPDVLEIVSKLERWQRVEAPVNALEQLVKDLRDALEQRIRELTL